MISIFCMSQYQFVRRFLIKYKNFDIIYTEVEEKLKNQILPPSEYSEIKEFYLLCLLQLMRIKRRF